MDLRTHIIEGAKKIKGKVIFPESEDVRVLKASQMLTKDGIASVVLLASNGNEKVLQLAKKENIDLSAVEIIEKDMSILDKSMVNAFVEARMKKGLSKEDALALLNRPAYFAAMYLKSGKCDVCVCGAVYETAEVLRAGIHVAGTLKGIKLVSSYFIMIPPENHPLIKDPVFFTDCVVNPFPDPEGLKDIAVATTNSHKKLFPNREVNVAFLSFSTKGSAGNKVANIIEATNLTKEALKNAEGVNVDGEIQLDAAIMPSVAIRKAPSSKVAGKANVLVFPDLNAGNIGYKLAERFGNFQALGPVIQGLALPITDLSRGCKPEDIYFTSAIMLLQCGKN